MKGNNSAAWIARGSYMTNGKTEWEMATTWAEMQFDAMNRHIDEELNCTNPAPSQQTVEMLRLLKERVDAFHQFWIYEIKHLRGKR